MSLWNVDLTTGLGQHAPPIQQQLELRARLVASDPNGRSSIGGGAKICLSKQKGAQPQCEAA